jgi:hypothetical protein
MIIDEQASIKSILKAMAEGNKAEEIAKQIEGTSQKPFLNALKAAGYKYSNKAPKGWYYAAGGVEPLNKSIFDFHMKQSSTPKKRNSHVVHDEFTSSDTNIIPSNSELTVSSSVHVQFTNDEVSMIKEMLSSWQEAVPAVESVHDRIKHLSQGNKTRKTIVINENIGKHLDKFCGFERVNKSDVLNLALIDFLEKYSENKL